MKFCCDELKGNLSTGTLKTIPKFREIGVPVNDGGSAIVKINYCPWCGTKLPRSLRDDWFVALEELDLDPYSENIPEKFKTSTWWDEK
jgi:hypothetical protein